MYHSQHPGYNLREKKQQEMGPILKRKENEIETDPELIQMLD